jgi:hypothetical protein
MSLILNGTTGISDVDGTAAAPAICGTDSNTGIFFPAADTIGFAEGGAEIARFDSSGNLGIGTSSPAGILHVLADGTNVDIQTSNNSNFSKIRFKGSGGSVGGQISGLGGGSGVAFYYATTEAARIDSSGNLLVATTSASATTLGAWINKDGNSGRFTAVGDNSGTGATFLANRSDTGATVYLVRPNGNVLNANNSYGSLSDIKLKENVVNATPKLDKLNQVRIVNYNLIGDTQKQIGVIAQELEEVCPSMVEETADRDAEGNDLGTTTKSVKYSVFVPMLIKAVQEQQALITALTTRITALEAA